MRKRILILLTAALVLCGAFVPAGTAPAEKSAGRKTTVMMYVCGADLEAVHAQATTELKKINQLHFNTEEINVVAVLGGCTQWRRQYDPEKLTLVELGGRTPKQVNEWPVTSMGDPDTLTGFLNYCKEHYPAERYDLILWDHGGGPNEGVCFDVLFGSDSDPDSLSVNELASALGNSVFADRGLDLILFNTCLTGAVEYAVNLAPFARYMVATEDSMYGLDYGWIKMLDRDESPRDIATAAVDGTYQLNAEAIEVQNAHEVNSVAAIDLTKAETLAAAMNTFFGSVRIGDNPDSFLMASRQRRDTQTFGITESGGANNRDLADLGDLVEHLKGNDPEGAKKLLDALHEAVVYHRGVTEACSGLTVYHPYANKSRLTKYMAAHNDIPLSETYSDYIQRFAAYMTGTPLADWANLHLEGQAKKDRRSVFTLKLKEEQGENLAYARVHVLQKQEDGSFRQVYDTPSVLYDPETLTLTGEYNGTALYAAADTDRASPALAYEIDGNGNYMIPALLTRKGEEDIGDFTAQALILCGTEAGSKDLIPGGVLLMDEASGGYTGIYNMVFSDFTEISVPVVSRTEKRLENGALAAFSEWEAAEPEYWTAPIDGSWTFGIRNDTLDEANLYAAFELTDAQYNRYSTELSGIKPEFSSLQLLVTYDDMNLVLISGFSMAEIQSGFMVSADVKNICETEAVIRLENLLVNGIATNAGTEVVGNGANWGLMQDETQHLSLSLTPEQLPVTPEEINILTFDLTLINAASEEVIGTVPVNAVFPDRLAP